MNSITSRTPLVTLVFLTLWTAMALPATAQDQVQDQPRFRIGFYFEGYMINDKNFKNFYHHSQRNLLGFEASILNVYKHDIHKFDVWASYRIFRDEAITTFYEKADKFSINAASVGLQYRPIRWKFFEPFVGAGLELYSYKETVEAGSDILGASGNAMGFYVQAGTYVDIYKSIALTAFYRYNGVKKTLANPLPDGSISMDLGGHEFGGGNRGSILSPCPAVLDQVSIAGYFLFAKTRRLRSRYSTPGNRIGIRNKWEGVLCGSF